MTVQLDALARSKEYCCQATPIGVGFNQIEALTTMEAVAP